MNQSPPTPNQSSKQPFPASLPSGAIGSSPSISVGHAGGKEIEGVALSPNEEVSEVSAEVEVPQTVERAGVVKIAETIELPPDVKKLGVTQTGAATPLTQTTSIPSVQLPISDTQVVGGLSASVSLALRWLAVWCIKRLKKAHVALKVIHGRIIRVEQK